MTITAAGYAGTMSEAQWARMAAAIGKIRNDHGVLNGLVVTAAAGTRTVSISAGTGLLPGVLADSDSAVSKTFDANTGSGTRVDYVVLRTAWPEPDLKPDFDVVKGSSSTPPALTQVAGTLWQMQLARVKVRPGVTTFADSDIEVCKPLPVKTYLVPSSAMDLDQAIGPASSGRNLSAATLPDLGWPYRIRVEAEFRVAGDSSYGRARVLLDGSSIMEGVSGGMTTTNGMQPLIISETSRIAYSGSHLVQLQFYPDPSLGTGQEITATGTGVAHFNVEQIPA